MYGVGGGALATTGAGIMLFGQNIGLATMVAGATVLIVGGATLYRVGTRRRKHSVAS
jgi:hypothetical protein